LSIQNPLNSSSYPSPFLLHLFWPSNLIYPIPILHRNQHQIFYDSFSHHLHLPLLDPHLLRIISSLHYPPQQMKIPHLNLIFQVQLYPPPLIPTLKVCFCHQIHFPYQIHPLSLSCLLPHHSLILPPIIVVIVVLPIIVPQIQFPLSHSINPFLHPHQFLP